MKKLFLNILEWIRNPFFARVSIVYDIYYQHPFTGEIFTTTVARKKDAEFWKKASPFVIKIKRRLIKRAC